MDIPQAGDRLHKNPKPTAAVGTLTHDERLREVLAAMYGVGMDAQEQHDKAVENLKRERREMMVARAPGCTPRSTFGGFTPKAHERPVRFGKQPACGLST